MRHHATAAPAVETGAALGATSRYRKNAAAQGLRAQGCEGAGMRGRQVSHPG
ncbi:hypothetical protein JYU34_004824 [Plutella xylostella]|uniref:Uncharacterized protein n=1 Tax=Plutella xylostella TaxID=51655 RepID=A0ABQ7QVB8_PLUXY|nr:hypothetical protein JYU34_004824 [Plutella xylostella]